jgi:hypothetical protein
MLTAAIMQPTYLPWLGYFDLMDRSDVFVFLDSVQFNTRSWQQRNRIKTASGELLLTVPVFTKGRRDQRIAEAEIDRTAGFADKHLDSIAQHYRNAPYFADYFGGLEAIVRCSSDLLSDLTMNLTGWLRDQLGITTRLIRSSEMAVTGSRVELLVAICEAVGASRYLSPAGSQEYITANNLFESHGITLEYQDYRHPVYLQLHGEFWPNMSALDLIFNEGPRSLEIIRQGSSRSSLPEDG